MSPVEFVFKTPAVTLKLALEQASASLHNIVQLKHNSTYCRVILFKFCKVNSEWKSTFKITYSRCEFTNSCDTFAHGSSPASYSLTTHGPVKSDAICYLCPI